MKFFSKTKFAAQQAEPTPAAETRRGRGYTVGWLPQLERTSVIWDAPRPFRPDHDKNPSAKSVSQCPAVLDFDRRFFVVNSPIDLHLRLSVNDGELGIANLLHDRSPVRDTALQQMIMFQPQPEWRHPNRPVMQMLTNYVFVSDDPLYINQYPPFLHYNQAQRPGVQLSGRFPVDIWPRTLQWGFEWWDMSKDLILKRGEPLFYVLFEGPDPTAPVRLIEAKRTPELMSHIESISGVTEYVSQTYSLFENARERRPERLLFPKD